MTSALELTEERTRLLARIEEINAEIASMGVKQCSKCKKIKPPNEFYQHSGYKDGLYHWCKQCAKEYNREKYANSGYRQAYTANRKALSMGAEGTFTDEQFVELCERYDNRCLRCGKVKKLTVDHIIPLSQGGSNDISNIQPLCLSCNSKKHTQTIDYRNIEQNKSAEKPSQLSYTFLTKTP